MKSFKAVFLFLYSLNILIVRYTTAEMIVRPGIKVGELKLERNHIGNVKGFRSCGGSGKLLGWRYESCVDSDPVCHVPADGIFRWSEVDFIPSKNIADLGARFSLKSTDGKIDLIVDEGPAKSRVRELKKGIPYTFTATGGVTEDLKGKDAVFQYILYDMSDDSVEACGEADLLYV